MGLVTKLTRQALQVRAAHLEVECTYEVVLDADGSRYLQLDTYGSSKRKIHGKKSQSIRFSPSALEHLKAVIRENGL